MDEILQEPQPLGRAARRTSSADAGSGAGHSLFARLRAWSAHTYDKLSAAFAGRPVLDPVPFLAAAAVIGVAATVGVVYTPSYVVTVNGADVGLVKAQSVFEQVETRVESRARDILGYEYTLDNEVSYDFALAKRGELTPVAELESYLFNTIDEVIQGYSLTVDGQFIGAARDRAALDALLEEIKAPYLTENTVSAEFVQPVRITNEYLPASVEQDRQVILSALTANTNGETVYEVVKGDTFMAIALDNNMTMKELQELNPDIDINRLYIGQLLTVREEIPFLSVQTTENVTYEEEIACPVEEVPDSSMYQGESRVLDAGIPGTASVNASVTYLNGKETGRDVLSSETLVEPTVRVVAVGTKERPSWYPNGYFIWPVQGRINSSFGWRSIFGSYSYHGGIDIKASYGQSIKAADGGTVIFAGYKGSYGNLVIIDHGNGKVTYYGHNSSLCVSAGSKVYQGQTIAKAGSTGRSTGVHCHFEIRINGTQVNPLSYL